MRIKITTFRVPEKMVEEYEKKLRTRDCEILKVFQKAEVFVFVCERILGENNCSEVSILVDFAKFSYFPLRNSMSLDLSKTL